MSKHVFVSFNECLDIEGMIWEMNNGLIRCYLITALSPEVASQIIGQ